MCKICIDSGYVTVCNLRVFCKTGVGRVYGCCVFGLQGLQGAAVQLAVQRDRQLRDGHETCGHHVDGQALAAVVAQDVVIGQGLACGCHQPGHQTALAIGRALVGDGGIGHGRMAGQHGLDLARLDAKAPDLELAIQPTQVLQAAIVEPAHGVAGAVEHVVRTTERIGDKAFLGEIRAVQVAQGHARATDVEFAGQAGGNGIAQRAQHAHVGPVDGTAQRHGGVAVQIVFGNRSRDGKGGGLGGAVAVDQLQSGQCLQRPAHMTGRQGLTARHQRAQTLQVQRILVDDAVEERSGQPRGVDPFGADGLGQAGTRGDGLRMDDAGAPIEQRAPDLQRRGIEGQRRCVQHHHLRAQRGVILSVDQPDDGTMGDDHPLGRACGTGGIHHVGGLARRAAVPGQLLLGQSLRQAGHGVEAHKRVGVVVVDAFDVQRRDAACLGQRQLMGLGMRIHQQQRGLAVFQHQRQALFRAGRVDGHVDSAQAQDAQHQGDGFGPA